MFDDPAGPLECYEWGKYTIHGNEYQWDIMVYGMGGGLVLVEKWREFRDTPGVKHLVIPEMLHKVSALMPDVVIIGIGASGAARVRDDVKDFLGDSVQLLIVRTPEACRIFNELHNEGKSVLAYLHGTC